MENIITIQTKQLKINDNPKAQYWLIITLFIISLLSGIGLLNREMNTINIVFLGLIAISCFVSVLYLLRRDFSDEILIENISHINLKLNIKNNFIVRIITKKGKMRYVNLMDNQQEIHRLIENCEKYKITLLYKKEMLDPC